MEAETPVKRGRGRPKGVKNKKPWAQAGPRLVPQATTPNQDFKYADPNTLVARQLSLIDWAQLALRREIDRGAQANGLGGIGLDDIQRIEKLSNGLVRAIEALRRVTDIAEELKNRMTPEELLEAAVKKVEGQSPATIRYAIKRLRAFLETLGPVEPGDRGQMGELKGQPYNAAAAIAALGD